MQIMLTLNPGFPPIARAWVDQLPDIPCAITEWVYKRGISNGASGSKKSILALEVFIIHGPRSSYGLLGGEFVPGDSGELAVQVGVCQTGQTVTDWSLARGLDAVKTGIPTWAAEDIVNAALEAPETQLIGPGCLRFTLGAHGEIGSNPWVFRGLARALIDLILLDGPVSEEMLSSILRKNFNLASRTDLKPSLSNA